MGLTELVPPVGPRPGLGSAHPQCGAQCPGLDLPQCPPVALPLFGVGWALTTRLCLDEPRGEPPDAPSIPAHRQPPTLPVS